MKIIFCIDLDAFFASVEQRENPELRGKAVVVGDQKIGRGVVSTASYEARKFGIKSGMPISEAYKLCPQAIFLPVRFSLYQKVSYNIMEILKKYGKFEQVSIDEAFLDVSEKIKDFDEAKQLAILIKEEIYEKEGITCSIGIAPNKLIAKIASNFKKPDGLTVVKNEEIKSFLSPLSVRELPGIGPKTEKVLNEIGIKTIGDLAKADILLLIEKFGKIGMDFHRMAKGIDNEEVSEKHEIKSIGREHTFERDTNDLKLINRMLESLAKEVHDELRKENFMFRTVTIKVRYEDFETHTHNKSLNFTDSLEDMIFVGKKLLSPFLHSKKRIRLIGIRVSNLMKTQTKLNFS